MNNIYWLDKIQPLDRDYLGDKAFYQSYLMQEGYPVMPGFVIPPEFFWQFIREIDWSDPLFADIPHSSLHINIHDYGQLQTIAQGIRFYISTAPLPDELVPQLKSALSYLNAEFLVFCPSLTSPSPDTSGILETRVCEAEIDAVIFQIKQVWADFFSAKSLFYWQQKKIFTKQLKPTLLVQSLPGAIASGNLKAVGNNWEIQATFGLSFALTRGEVAPDSYQVNPETKTVINKTLGNKAIAYNLARSTGNLITETTVTHAQLPLPEYLSGLEIYLLSEEKQNEDSLKENELKKLIELSQKLKTIFGDNFYLEWSLASFDKNTETQFYITLGKSLINTELINEIEAEKSVIETPKLSGDNSGIIKGLAAGPGRIKAIAVVITNPTQNNLDFLKGKILVVPSVLPAYFPLVTKAAGIIAERGGMTSHGAILSQRAWYSCSGWSQKCYSAYRRWGGSLNRWQCRRNLFN